MRSSEIGRSARAGRGRPSHFDETQVAAVIRTSCCVAPTTEAAAGERVRDGGARPGERHADGGDVGDRRTELRGFVVDSSQQRCATGAGHARITAEQSTLPPSAVVTRQPLDTREAYDRRPQRSDWAGSRA